MSNESANRTAGNAATASEATALAGLSPQQRTAIEWLTAGETAEAAAAVVGVNRRTVHRWMKTDPEFQAAYNAWQADTLATAKAQLVAATGAAVRTVVASLAKGDAKTAMALLNKLGLLVPPTPGQVEPDKVARSQRAEREREEMQLFNEEETAIMGHPPGR